MEPSCQGPQLKFVILTLGLCEKRSTGGVRREDVEPEGVRVGVVLVQTPRGECDCVRVCRTQKTSGKRVSLGREASIEGHGQLANQATTLGEP